jgi:hypothetical protein
MPVTSSEFVYYGGFHIFSSAVFVTTSSGPTLSSTWIYWGGFHVFQLTTLAPVTTSSGAAVSTFRHLITHHYLTRLSDIRF